MHAKNEIAVVMYKTCMLPLNKAFAIVFPKIRNNEHIINVEMNVRLIIG